MLHVPVLATEVLEMASANEFQPKTYLDCTFGRGGHARLFMQKFEGITVTAIDRDLEAVAFAKENFAAEIAAKKFEIIHGNFSDISSLLAADQKFDLILADLGVSSPQLDQGHRGFSFYHDGPLDMRMDTSSGIKASDVINEWDEEDLEKLFVELGEIHNPHRVIRAIVHDRKENPFTTTRQLAGLIERVEGWSRKGVHPATKHFMALRLRVNNEIDALESSMSHLVDRLNLHGRLLVITFHSLEDRICKYAFRSFDDRGRVINKKVVQPTWKEQQENSRARSAKLRGFERE